MDNTKRQAYNQTRFRIHKKQREVIRGHMYVVFNPETKWYKIGFTEGALLTRFANLKGETEDGELIQLIMIFGFFKKGQARKAETEAHRKFDGRRRFGEWFKLKAGDLIEMELFIKEKFEDCLVSIERFRAVRWKRKGTKLGFRRKISEEVFPLFDVVWNQRNARPKRENAGEDLLASQPVGKLSKRPIIVFVYDKSNKDQGYEGNS